MSDTPKTAVELLAERRQRRRAAARRWAWRSSFVAGALTLLIAFALYWLLATVGGRNVLLNQIKARLPENATFTWRDADGPAAGPLTLRGVHFAYEGIDFRAERVYLNGPGAA